ncbi:MAG: SH3 domain-containing protein [Sphingomonas sp.]|nr:SH3 domain-containing protein [Sphingomonas sp.]
MIPILSLLIAAAAPDPAVIRLSPVDECAADLSFAAFREKLRDAISRRDAGYLLGVTADDATISFGGLEGPAGLAEHWRLDGAGDSELWDVLEATLALGCAVDSRGVRVSPSFFLQAGEDDWFETFLAITPDAPLLSAPRPDAEVIARLDWDVLTWLGEDEGMFHMRLADGRTGYVEPAYVRNLIAHRAGFARRDGHWRMVFFVAGD